MKVLTSRTRKDTGGDDQDDDAVNNKIYPSEAYQIIVASVNRRLIWGLEFRLVGCLLLNLHL